MGDLANSLKDLEVLHLENLDIDLRPPYSALEFTKRAIEDDAANSYPPFFELDSMCQATAQLVERQSGQPYDWKTEYIISAGGLLLELGKIAAIPVVNWGSARSDQYIRMEASEPRPLRS